MAPSLTPKTPENDAAESQPDLFKRFDVVSDPSDHHFYRSNLPKNTAGQGCFTSGGSKVHKKIMHEWKILEKHLPDSIYVRVYDTRIDLLQAVIVGAAGTPYHDALFFFDIAFPNDYPTRPPQVYYHSFGNRVNPNLYATGYVCLSLLNTWSGSKGQKWNPSQSTILQVLVSIQGLVLNEKPYFNEPGTGIFGRGRLENTAQAYGENAFLLTHKTTHILLRRPPKHFRAFVAEHFRQRAGVILRACIAYAKGLVAVGEYKEEEEEGHQNGAVSVIKVRRSFREPLEKLYAELYKDFKWNGDSLVGLPELLKVEAAKTTPSARKEGSSGSIVGRVFRKLKKVLGLGPKNKIGKKGGSESKRNAAAAAAAAADLGL
ncbi:putative ubiquitin-conjugating enzyme E2 38 [Pyrus communis]|uniref:putative ubiquitin-conjugating enzyme E2 38 n=1 Tax=Pyrus communis TaxID=23211 RepID=UPI0035C1A1BF